MPAERATHTIGRALRRPLTSQRALPILVPETRSNCWQRGVGNISEVPLRTAIEVPFATRARRWEHQRSPFANRFFVNSVRAFDCSQGYHRQWPQD